VNSDRLSDGEANAASKPFSYPELDAWIGVLLRRTSRDGEAGRREDGP